MGGSGPLYVFEAAVDLMSYVSLYPKDWRQGNYLALNGTAEAALFRTLEEYPEVRGVVLALDKMCIRDRCKGTFCRWNKQGCQCFRLLLL